MKVSKDKILVIGAGGQVGRSFRKCLGDVGTVFYTERRSNSAQTMALDLSDTDEIRTLIRKIRPQVIINCAAYTAVDLAEKEPDLAMKVNGEAVEAMAKAAAEVGAVLIHYSTDYVFDGTGSKPWLEFDKTGPVNTYGKSKLAGEKAVLEFATRGYVFRTQWVYDKGGKNFLSTMLRLGAEREEIGVVCDQIGAPTSSDVIAAFTLKALEKILSGSMAPGIYHLTCRGEVSWHGFAERIFEFAREHGIALKVRQIKKIETKDYPTPAIRPKNSRLSLAKFEQAIGESLPPWEDTLRRLF